MADVGNETEQPPVQASAKLRAYGRWVVLSKQGKDDMKDTLSSETTRAVV